MQYIEVETAKTIIREQIFHTEKTFLPLLQAQGYYTAEPIFATTDVPSFDNSAMDGYGFRFEDIKDSSALKVVEIIPAGHVQCGFSLGKGEAVRIFTGAGIPVDIDTVIIQEKVERNGDFIHFDRESVRKGDNIRGKGSQTKSGECIVGQNTFINHSVIGFLAGCGIAEVKVFDKVKIGFLYTGNELVEPGQPLSEGKIYNANAYTIRAALAEIGHQLSFVQHAEDTEEATVSSIEKALKKVDVLLISGGISVGDYDFVKTSLEQNGVEQLFYKLKQKPGKPLFFGKKGKKYVFALPGNPASVFTCYHQYVKPFLLGCCGRDNFYGEQDFAVLTNEVRNKRSQLTLFLKARFESGKVTVLNSQESYKMDALVLTNCFVEFSSGKEVVRQGEIVRIWKI